MSWPKLINVTSPVTSFASYISLVHANVTPTKSDGGQTYTYAGCQKTTQSGIPCIVFQYQLNGTGNYGLYIFYNPAYVQNVDYPDIFKFDSLLFKILDYGGPVGPGHNSAFVYLNLSTFAYASQASNVSVSSNLTSGWSIYGYAIPTPVYLINPGINPCTFAYTSSWGNLPSNAITSTGDGVSSDNFTVSFDTNQPGGENAFTTALGQGLSDISAGINGDGNGVGVVPSLDALNASAAAIAQHLDSIRSDLASALGGAAGPGAFGPALAAAAAAVTDGLANGVRTQIISGSSVEITGGSDIATGMMAAATVSGDAIGTTIAGALGSAASAIGSALASAGSAIASAISSGLSGLGSIASSIGSAASGIASGIGGAIGIASAEGAAGAAGIAEAVEGVSGATAAAAGTIAAAETASGAAIAGELTVIGEAGAGTALALTETLPAVFTTALSPIGAAVLAGGSLWALSSIIHDLVETVKNIKDIASDGKVDIKGDALAKLSCICEALDAGLYNESGPFLLRLVQAIGDPVDEPLEDEEPSMRNATIAIQEQLKALYLVNDDTGERISMAQLVNNQSIVVSWKKGRMLFEYGS